MSKIEVNTVEPQCGTTLTLGGSGDTVALGSGASQTGFGKTGAVNWDTASIKTATFTAVSGNGYFCNTTGGVFNITMPASPSAGDIVGLKDYAGTFATNNLTIDRNGSKLDAAEVNRALNTDFRSLTMVYVDGTQGWVPIEEGTGYVGESFTVASGGDSTLTVGDYKTHIFTGPGTFTVCSIGSGPNAIADYIVVAGAGSGGGYGSGGGGAGGFRLSNTTCMPAPETSPLSSPTGLTLTATPYPITVGAGSTGGQPGNCNSNPGVWCGATGSNSVFDTITSNGGGKGTGYQAVGGPGGSGGGARGAPAYPGTGFAGGCASPVTVPAQGKDGGRGFDGLVVSTNGGGGGGAGTAGSDAPGAADTAGNGGPGSYIADAILGPTASSYGTPGPVSSTRYFSGGGGGGSDGAAARPSTGGTGGSGGGGAGAGHPTSVGTAGTINTGGGGGGGAAPSGSSAGGNGASGIVMIRYKFQ